MNSAILTLQLWALLLVMQALFINGIKLGTLGTPEILPDGTEKDPDMLLYKLYKFLTQFSTAKVYYSNAPLVGIIDKLLLIEPALNGFISYSGNVVTIGATCTVQAYAIGALLRTPNFKNVEIEVKHANTFSCYGMVDTYKYPAWIRKPVIQCIICMSSFWGIFLFLIPMLIIEHFEPWVFLAYIVNTVLLATVNKIIYNLSN